jgi:hypothetical protein
MIIQLVPERSPFQKDSWSQEPSTIPSNILDALAHHPKSRADKRHTIDEMELNEETFQAGDSYVVDEIEKDGDEMLVTKYGQTKIALTGRNIKCARHKLAMIGRPYFWAYIEAIP